MTCHEARIHDRIGGMIRHSQMPLDPALIFMQADGFSSAYALMVAERIDPKLAGKIAAPAIVMSALASELFLKCLVCLETGKAPRGHYLKQLFDGVSIERRRLITAIWDGDIVPLRSPSWDQMKLHFGEDIPRALPDALSAANQAFEKVRYSYEDELDGLRFILGDLPWVLKRVILQMCPDWRGLRRVMKPMPGPKAA